jgi:hypothetical protein
MQVHKDQNIGRIPHQFKKWANKSEIEGAVLLSNGRRLRNEDYLSDELCQNPMPLIIIKSP